MKTDSKEFKDLMKKWSEDAWKEEIAEAKETYLETEDMNGKLPRGKIKS